MTFIFRGIGVSESWTMDFNLSFWNSYFIFSESSEGSFESDSFQTGRGKSISGLQEDE